MHLYIHAMHYYKILLITYIHVIKDQSMYTHPQYIINTHTHTPLATPPRKKCKISKKTKSEKLMEKTIESFMTFERQAEEKFKSMKRSVGKKKSN